MRILNYAIILILLFTSCDKDWLDAKSSSGLVVPSSISELKQLLNYGTYIHIRQLTLIETSSGDFIYPTSVFNNLSPSSSEYKAYIWQNDGNYSTFSISTEWDNSYKKIGICNVVLESLQDIDSLENREEWNAVKGTALFYRAEAFHDLAQHFSQLYNPETASSDMGIPLLLTTDLNTAISRASVAETYDRILKDLEESVPLLPEQTENKYDPSTYAASSLLARIYLFLGDFEKAFFHANTCLNNNSTLLDFEQIDTTLTTPFRLANPELIKVSNIQPSAIYATGIIDTTLLQSYQINDRRRPLFFSLRADGTYGRKNSYTGGAFLFGGSSVSEMLLTRAECYARAGELERAMEDINYLLGHRITDFVPLSVGSASETLDIILTERRKELVGRAIRWLDLKRLNREPARTTTLVRNTSSGIYTLPPNDPQYTFLIPNYIIQSTGITQNPQ